MLRWMKSRKAAKASCRRRRSPRPRSRRRTLRRRNPEQHAEATSKTPPSGGVLFLAMPIARGDRGSAMPTGMRRRCATQGRIRAQPSMLHCVVNPDRFRILHRRNDAARRRDCDSRRAGGSVPRLSPRTAP
ncbi:hypothetical protein [Lysobacter gummosus]|uniref:hypothetical protein n=1 Tax=Lysobacter gummosus TaxID=262324 RepID=UPI0036294FFE